MTPSKKVREVQPLRDVEDKNASNIAVTARKYAYEYSSHGDVIGDSNSDSESDRSLGGYEVAIKYS